MKTLIILILLSGWRQGNYVLETTVEHQLLPTYDTIVARHYHKVNDKFYIITTDSTELWVDNVKEIRK